MRSLAVPLLLAALLLALRLIAPNDLKSTDQGKSAQYVLYSWQTGDLLVPKEQGTLPPTKPPLATWVGLGFSVLTGGPTELSIRLPSVLAALLLVLLTGLIARRLTPDPVPAIACLVMAGNYVFLKTATVVRPDMLLAVSIAASIWFAMRALEGEGRVYAWLAGLALGLGLLAKGPVALVVVVLAIVPWAFLRADRPPLRRLDPLVSVPLMLLVFAAWAVPAFLREGESLWNVMVVDELSRHAAGHGKPPWSYLLSFPGRFVPWVLFLPAGLVAAWRDRRVRPGWPLGLFFCWFVLGFVALSLAGSKRADYLLPIVPGAAALTAVALARRSRVLSGLFLAVAGALVLLAAGYLVLGPERTAALFPKKPKYEPLAGILAERGTILVLAMLATAGLAVVGWAFQKRGRAAAAATMLFLVYLSGTALSFFGVPEISAESTATRRFAGVIEERVPKDAELLIYRVGSWTNALSFFLGRAEPPATEEEVRAPGHRYVATSPEGREEIEEWGVPLRVLHEIPRVGRGPGYFLLELSGG